MKSVLLCLVFLAVGSAQMFVDNFITGPERDTPEQIFERMDVNNDKNVVPDEYLRRNKYMVNASEQLFDEYDKNKDKKVTLDELLAHRKERLEESRQMDEKYRIQHVSSFIEENDKNKDKVLDIEELKAYFEQNMVTKVDRLAELLKPFDKNNDGKFDANELFDMRLCI
ncbi:hypothetical protein QR680_005211 [Steinernema hermaphroditum]|uniref:EF-hand domain-containing protein n=1 Tax=Steinernema hermaphroditum TaxID=289476 RepID=A0AA39LV93_9BILA|nr:hypothetical protein QR680_005211 [Steinernema hermaphroditum]